MNYRKGERVTHGGRDWIVVACDPELDQVRIRRRIWDRASGTSRTIYATPTTTTLRRENP